MLSSLTEPEQIRYRQDVLRDCLQQRGPVREIYDLAVRAISEQKSFRLGIFGERPESLLRRSIDVLGMFVGVLRELRGLGELHGDRFASPGFVRFFDMVRAELDDDYLATVAGHLKALRFRNGVLLSARLGAANQGVGYVLRTPRPENGGGLLRRAPVKRPTFSLTIPDRDESGFTALAELRDRALGPVADALTQSADHVLDFFRGLRAELGFYLGCMNLDDQLGRAAGPRCFPEPRSGAPLRMSARGLYDPCLSLRLREGVTDNDLAADAKPLIMITGANQGGKSTFLRSLGLAQLMMQCGMFVTAASFSATVAERVFTHYKREEDATMAGGKLDEELDRLSDVVDCISAGSLLLCNESFASTNEREGSEIAFEVLRAMVGAGVRVVFVTHLFDVASRIHDQGSDGVLFLRAERRSDGQRTFRITEGEPLPTSYGRDLYERMVAAGSR